MQKKTRPAVLIASPDIDVRTAWRRALRRSFSVHDTGGMTGLDSVLRALEPDVLILDLGLRRLRGVQSLPSSQKLSPSTKIIVMTDAPQVREEINALRRPSRSAGRNLGAARSYIEAARREYRFKWP